MSVEVGSLTKQYGAKGRDPVTALRDVDLSVKSGELLVLLGPSGCGKTTLLRSIAGLTEPTEGSISIKDRKVFDSQAGVNVKPRSRGVGLVFQHFALWPHMTVRANVAYPLKAQKLKSLLDAGKVDEVLKGVRCLELAERLPSELSGGQQQRIALARALVAEPGVMLFDEPLSALDALLRTDLRQELRDLHHRFGFTGVFVTHDQSEALFLGDRIAVMSNGVIAQLGTPEEIFQEPSSPYVADFIGIRNAFPISVEGGNFHAPFGLIAGLDPAQYAPPSGADLQCFFRPDDVRLLASDTAGRPSQEDRAFLGRGLVTDRAYSGRHWNFSVTVEDYDFVCRVPLSERPPFDRGDTVSLELNARGALIYAGEVLLRRRSATEAAGGPPQV